MSARRPRIHSDRIELRLSVAQRERIRAAAADEQVSDSELVRRAVDEKVQGSLVNPFAIFGEEATGR